MWSIFLRQILLLILGISLVGYSGIKISNTLLDSYFQRFFNETYPGAFNVLEYNLYPDDKAISKAEFTRNMERLKKNLGGFNINLYPLDSFSADVQEILLRGEIWYDQERDIIVRLTRQHQQVFSLEPPEPSNMLLIKISLYLLISVCFGAVYYLIILRPFWHDLQTLRQVARELGEGKLDRRASLKKRSSLQGLASRMNEMAERIEQLIKQQNELLNAVAHELRTPLARTRFALTMQDSADSERLQTLRKSALDDLDEMETLIRELLGYGRLDARTGSPVCQAIPTRIWLSELVQHQHARLPVRLELEQAPATLHADPTLLEHALTNILGNAQRHAEQSILLSCKTVAKEVELRIEDDGPGVPQAQSERIFEPFIRLDDSRSRDTGGIGLGLAIVRRIIERHQGKVWVEASKNSPQGACFIIRLPMQASALAAS